MSYAATLPANDYRATNGGYGQGNQNRNRSRNNGYNNSNNRNWRQENGERQETRRNQPNNSGPMEYGKNRWNQQNYRQEPRQTVLPPPPPGLEVKPHQEAPLLSAPPGFEHVRSAPQVMKTDESGWSVHPLFEKIHGRRRTREEVIKAIQDQKNEKETMEKEDEKTAAASDSRSETGSSTSSHACDEYRVQDSYGQQKNRSQNNRNYPEKERYQIDFHDMEGEFRNLTFQNTPRNSYSNGYQGQKKPHHQQQRQQNGEYRNEGYNGTEARHRERNQYQDYQNGHQELMNYNRKLESYEQHAAGVSKTENEVVVDNVDMDDVRRMARERWAARNRNNKPEEKPVEKRMTKSLFS